MSPTTSIDNTAPAPTVTLKRIDQICTVEIMENDLDGLDRVFASEQSALGFFTATGGVFLGAGLGWLGASGLSPVKHALFGVVTLTTFIFSMWFCVQWRNARAQRCSLLRERRTRSR